MRPVLSVLIILAVVPSILAQSPLAVPVDGEPFHARLTSIDAQGKLGFEAAGKPRTLAAADLVSWGQPAELRKGPILVLGDGGFLPAIVLGVDKGDLSVDSARVGPLKLPLDSLAGIVFVRRHTPRNWMPCSIASPADKAKPAESGKPIA